MNAWNMIMSEYALMRSPRSPTRSPIFQKMEPKSAGIST